MNASGNLISLTFDDDDVDDDVHLFNLSVVVRYHAPLIATYHHITTTVRISHGFQIMDLLEMTPTMGKLTPASYSV